jgi:hypothetical protein
LQDISDGREADFALLDQGRTGVLGSLISQLDRPDIAADVLQTLDPEVVEAVNARAAAFEMNVTDFVAGAVRTFVDSADDDLWFQLLTVMRKAQDPGLVAVQTIVEWAVTKENGAT